LFSAVRLERRGHGALMELSEPLVQEEARSCLSFDAGMSLRQRRILRVALRLFAENEYAGVSLRDIASEAGVSLTLIDHHFGAKHALFAAVVRSWCPVFGHAALEIRHALAQGRVGTAEELVAMVLSPVERLLADPDGPPVLRLWARHRHGTELAISGPMGLAIEPFRSMIERALERVYPDSAAADRGWAVGFAFAALLEFAVAELPSGESASAADPSSNAQRLLMRHVAAGWQASLGG
jgi:AcrR family transcriptional regulator